MPSANETLAADLIRRNVRMESWKAREVSKVRTALDDDVFPAVIGQVGYRLLRLPIDRGYGHVSRLPTWRSLLRESGKAMREGISTIRRKLVGDLRRMAADEVEFVAEAMGRQYRFRIPIARPERVSEVLITPYQGRTLVDHWRKLSGSAADAVEREIVQGVRQGQSVPEIMRRVEGLRRNPRSGAFGKIRTWSAVETETAVQHVRDGASNGVTRANDDKVKYEVWTATFENTCPRCLALHGERWPADEGPRPPLHPRCPCARLPVLKSARELGLPEDALPPIVREGLDGRPPVDITGDAWLRSQSVRVQDETLGKQRAQWFRAGRIQIQPRDLMERASNRLLRLEEIAARQRIDWEG